MVEIYGTPGCGFCVKAKKVCEANSFQYTYIDISDSTAKQQLLEKMPEELKTVPQIFVDGEFISGGYTGLCHYVMNN